MKTNGARFLESLDIPFELREYEVDPNDLSAVDGRQRKSACPPSRSSRLCSPPTELTTMSSPSSPATPNSISRNSPARLNRRKAEMAPLKDVQPLTGYIRGGVTIFGAKKPYPVFIDETLILFDRISVSAGTRGTQLILTPDDYLHAAAALGEPVTTADLTKDLRKEGAPSYPFRVSGEMDRVGDQPRSPDELSQRGRK